jgi:hypothetical protein
MILERLIHIVTGNGVPDHGSAGAADPAAVPGGPVRPPRGHHHRPQQGHQACRVSAIHNMAAWASWKRSQEGHPQLLCVAITRPLS